MDTIDLCGAVAGGLERNVSDIRNMSFYPSSASCVLPGGPAGGCLRKQYWYFIGEEQSDPPSENALVNMAMGDATHEFVVEQCKRVGIWAADERRIWEPSFNLSGRVDLFLWHGQQVVPVEIKSIHGWYGHQGVVKPSKTKPFAPKIEHVLQFFTYMDFYHRHPNALNGTPPYGLIFYIGRDNGARAQHKIEVGVVSDENGPIKKTVKGMEMEVTFPIVNGQNWEFITNVGIYERWEQLEEYVKNEELPPRDFTLQYSRDTLKAMADAGELTAKQASEVKADRWLEKGDWHCSYCSFKTKCWDGITKHDLFIGSADQTT